MKKLLLLLILGIMSAGLFAADGKAMVSTTMDFQDIVMCSPLSEKLGYFPLEQYEKELKNLADAGIKKLYLRTDAVGQRYHPSKVRDRYSLEHGGDFWSLPQHASWVENTINKYDPLAETIRIGHKYGMEVWAWEPIFEDVGSLAHITDSVDVRRIGHYCLCDKFFRSNPQYLAMPRPDKNNPSPARVKKINDSIKGRRIGKIVLTSERDRDVPLRLKADDLRVFVSNDNFDWQLYNGTPEITVVPRGKRITVTISSIDIPERFVKIVPKNRFPQDSQYCYVLITKRGNGKFVYDTNGKELPAVWGSTASGANSRCNDAHQKSLFLDYEWGNGIAWDYGSIGVGFGLGEPSPYGESFRRGMAELHIPAVMDFKLASFAELAAYDFDGFYFSSRTHSNYSGYDPDLFGFNPEVREKFMKRYGQDIWSPKFKDLKKLQEFRAEALDEYLAQCKKIAGKRPIYAAVPKISPSVQAKYGNLSSWCHLGSMPYNYEKWVKNGSVDGLIMHGWCDPAEFMALKKRYGIKISLFHKIKSHLLLKPDARLAHMKDILNLEGLDELEMYESCLISDHPQHLQIIRQAIDSKEAVPGGNNAALKRIQEQLNKFIWQ